MFWLPHGWFPGYAEWLVAFPRAPRGSVSIASWQIACTVVLGLLKDTILALVALVQEALKTKAKAPAGEKKEAAQKERKKEAPVTADKAADAMGEKSTATASGRDEL